MAKVSGCFTFPQIHVVMYFLTSFCTAAVYAYPQVFSSSLSNKASESWCATISFQKSFNLPDLNLFENKPMDRHEFERVRVGKLTNSVFHFGGNYTEPRICVLEICGCNGTATDDDSYCHCDKYTRSSRAGPVKANYSIYGGQYEIGTLSCACKTTLKTGCDLDICSIRKNISYEWKDDECAIFYPEIYCTTCFFTPIILHNGTHFETQNSYQIHSMLVRPNCYVESTYVDTELNFTRRDNMTGLVQDIFPNSYSKSSDNFSCLCKSFDPAPSKGDDNVWIYVVPTCSALGVLSVTLIVAVSVIRHCRSSTLPLIARTDSQSYLISPDDGAKGPTDDENRLNAEIGDEVRKLLHFFLRSLRQDQRTQPSSSVYADITDARVANNVTEISERLSQICQQEHVLDRNSFSISDQNLLNPLGAGHFGIVYRGELRRSNDFEQVAVKKLRWSSNCDAANSFLREVGIFANIGNERQYVIRFCGACCSEDGLYVLTQYCQRGSLRSHLVDTMRDRQTTIGDIVQLLKWCEKIASGMEYLDSKGIIHVDLAARNILLSDESTIKICDFGMSKKCVDEEACARSLIMGDFPLNSFSPEMNRENLNEPVQVFRYIDIWAFGCTCWEVFTLGNSLYPTVTTRGAPLLLAVRSLLLRKYRHPKPELAPDAVYAKLLECWKEIPTERPTFTELRAFFTQEISLMFDE